MNPTAPSPKECTRPSRPKVLQCISHFALGGAERVALDLSAGLRDEFDFEIFAVRGMADGEMGNALRDEAEGKGFRTHLGARVPMRRGGLVTSAFGLARVLRRVRPDLIHLHTEIPEAAYAALSAVAPWIRRTPVVRTIHNSVFWAFWPKFGHWCDRRLAAARVAAVSRAARDAYAEFHARSGAAGRETPCEIIPNGVRAPKRRRDVSAPPRPGLRLLFGGRFEVQKGVDLFPELLQRLAAPSDGPASLTLFGSGSLEPAMRRLASAPPAGWTVDVRMPVADFAERIADFDVLLMPSRYEGLGLVAVEAFHASVPVVGTDAAGLVEVYPPGYPWVARAGDAADFARACAQTVAERADWPRILAAARRHCETQFSPAASARAYASLFRSLLPADCRLRSGGENPVSAR